MVKKKVGGGKRYQAAAKAKSQGSTEPAWQGPAPPKHLQRKISKKVNFLDKVAASKTASLAARSAITKKPGQGKRKASRALVDLSSLSGSVKELLQQHALSKGKKKEQATGAGGKGSGSSKAPSTAAGPSRKKFGEGVGTLRARAAVMVKECERVQQVVHHPLYKADPIQAITNHLNATIPAAPPAAAQRQGKMSGKKKRGGKGKVVSMVE